MPRDHRQDIEVEASTRDRGLARDVAAELPDLPYVRLTQRERPPRDRRNLWLVLALVVAGHLLLGWLAYLILRPVPFAYDQRDVLAVSLIEPPAGLPPPPPLVPPPPLQGQPVPRTPAPPRRHHVPPAKGAIQATMQGGEAPALDLYGANGEIRVPPNAARAPSSAPAYATPELQGSQIYGGESPVPYKPTRFNKDWAPLNESLGAKTIGRAYDKAVEKTTLQKTVTLPGGVRVHCAVSPLLLFAGCKGDAPQPPPANDRDIRLSMPPPETLTGKKVVVPRSASSASPAAAGSR